MFDLGFAELLIIGTVALIVVGPKDLPKLFKQFGQFVGKARGMAREFSSAMNAAADESGMREINQTIKAASNPTKFGANKIREATGMDDIEAAVDAADANDPGPAKPGSETDKLRAKMTEDRAATAKKMNEAMAKAAEDRIAAEKAAEAAKAAQDATPAPKDAT